MQHRLRDDRGAAAVGADTHAAPPQFVNRANTASRDRPADAPLRNSVWRCRECLASAAPTRAAGRCRPCRRCRPARVRCRRCRPAAPRCCRSDPRVSTCSMRTSGISSRVALHECLAERPEVAGREAGRQPDRDGLLGAGRLDRPRTTRRARRADTSGRGPQSKRTRIGLSSDSCGAPVESRLLCATRGCRCQGIGSLCRNLSQLPAQLPAKMPRLINQASCDFFWRKYEDLVERSAPGGARVGGGERCGARRCMARSSATSPTKPGAALPGATVTITQRETNLTRDVVTNEAGGYNVPNLLPGTYQVDVKLAGFSTYTARDIAVRQGLDVRVDAQIEARHARGVDRRLRRGGRSADRERRGAVADDEQSSWRRFPPAAAPGRRRSR